MLTFRQLRDCEGYYYNVTTGEILRNVGPGEARCWREGSWDETMATGNIDAPQFELLTQDVMTPLTEVRDLVMKRYEHPAPHFLNRQAAFQPDGSVVTEEAPNPLPASEGAEGE